jgi:Phage tail tube protein, GTA-gp10
MKHTAFFGDATYTFALTDTVARELEQKAGAGIGFIFTRLTRNQFNLDDIIETIRLGLIGGGTSPEVAHRLVTTYAKDRPLAETLPLALDILDARWSGSADTDKAIWSNGEDRPAVDAQDELRQAAASGDLAAIWTNGEGAE